MIRIVVLLLSLTFAVSAVAEINIAVVNIQEAILSSDQAREKEGEFNKSYASEFEEINALGQDIQKMMGRFEQDRAVMSDGEKKKLLNEIEDKKLDFRFKREKLQKAEQELSREIVAKMQPKLQQVLMEIAESGEFDLILNRQAVISAKPQFDITKRVLEKLNTLK